MTRNLPQFIPKRSLHYTVLPFLFLKEFLMQPNTGKTSTLRKSIIKAGLLGQRDLVANKEIGERTHSIGNNISMYRLQTRSLQYIYRIVYSKL